MTEPLRVLSLFAGIGGFDLGLERTGGFKTVAFCEIEPFARRVLAGERSGLWREYARLIREIGPRYIVVENVSALLCRGLGDVLGDLAALGYDAEWDCIPACAVGAPHRRDRVWIVAYPCEERGERNGTVALSRLAGLPWRENGRRAQEWARRSALSSSGLCRASDGIPSRVDRVGALGNAVHAEIPELIGRAILASLEEAA